jgi:undecaprenyl-diphosphatase
MEPVEWRIPAAVGAFLAVAILTLFIGTGPEGWEVEMVDAIAGWSDGLEPAMWTVMQLGTRGAAIVVCLGVGFWSARTGLLLAAVAALSWATAQLLKDVVDRERPSVDELASMPREVLDTPGYPSTHTAIAAALGVGIIMLLPRLGRVRWALVVVPVLVGTARMYFGVHYPLDIVGGALIAAFFAVVASRWRPYGPIPVDN